MELNIRSLKSDDLSTLSSEFSLLLKQIREEIKLRKQNETGQHGRYLVFSEILRFSQINNELVNKTLTVFVNRQKVKTFSRFGAASFAVLSNNKEAIFKHRKSFSKYHNNP